MIFNIFGNTLTKRVEKKKRIEGQIEVLKKEEKVHFERAIKNSNARKETSKNEIDNNILLLESKIKGLESQIKGLESQKERKNFLLDEQLKVTLDEISNEYDTKITAKVNKTKNLEHLIEAERKSQEDILTPYQSTKTSEKTKVKLTEESKQDNIKE